MIPAEDLPIIEEALSHYQGQSACDQGQALVAICRDVLALNPLATPETTQDG
jgi:hypothetical protein